MYQTSDSFKKIVTHSNRKFHAGAHVDFSDGTGIEIDSRNIMADGGVRIDDAVSDTSAFELGSAIIGELQMTLNNYGGEFNQFNFKGAVIKPWVGITTAVHWKDGDIIEKIPKGVFNVLSAPTCGSTIQLTAEDNLSKFDIAYSKSTLNYPATLGQIAADVCSVCGVALATTTFPNSTYSVAKRPSDSAVTCREILSYVAQLAGCFTRCNTDGAVEIRWYEAGDADYDVGNLPTSLTISDNDVAVTGVQIQGNDNSGTVYSAGTNDFVLRIRDNPLAQDNLQSLVNALGTKLIGTTFRPCEATSLSNPAIEAGDIAHVTDKSGTAHKVFITKAEFSVGESETYYASAESKEENQSQRFSKADKAQSSADQAQDSADTAQQTADDAKDGVAKAEVKIGNLEITIKGKVSFSDLSGNGTTEINGSNIVTGKIESEDGSWWLNLETGEVYLSKGTFSGLIKWLKSSGAAGGQILYTEDGGLRIESSGMMTLDASSVEVGDISATTLNGVDMKDAVTGNWNVQMKDGSSHRFYFTKGILTDVD